MTVFRMFLKYCLRRKWLTTNTATEIKATKSQQKHSAKNNKYGLELHEYENVLRYMDADQLDHRAKTMIELMRYTGTRVSDAAKFCERELVRNLRDDGWNADSHLHGQARSALPLLRLPGCRQNGRSSCPTKSVLVRMIEDSVLDQLRTALRDSGTREKLNVPEALWQSSEQDQTALIRALVKEVSYDGTTGAVSLNLMRSEDTREN